MRQVLQSAHFPLVQRALPADMQHRAFRPKRGRNAGHRVGATRSGRRHHAAELAGLAGIAVGRMRGGLLMAHIDDADACVEATIVDVDNVTAAQREDGVDTLVLQRLGDEMAAGDDVGVGALARQCIVGRDIRGLDGGCDRHEDLLGAPGWDFSPDDRRGARRARQGSARGRAPTPRPARSRAVREPR